MSEVFMKCGHTQNTEKISKDGTKKPYCFICGCSEVAETKPDLTGRKARCVYYGLKVNMRRCETYYPEMLTTNYRGEKCCGSLVDSDYKLPFFEHKPNSKEDKFYCGCSSWD